MNYKDEELRATINAIEIERHRIAKDLHDSIGQQLSAIKLYLGTLKNIPAGKEQLAKKVLLSKSILAVDEASAELSTICYNLMPASLRVSDIVCSLKELAGKISLSKKINVLIEASPGFPILTKEMDVDIFRVVQEFINNSIKHGKAKYIGIQLKYNKAGKKIYILLKDTGKGFDMSKKNTSGLGLTNVKSRIEAHKGTLLIKSSVHIGTAYKIVIPFKNNHR